MNVQDLRRAFLDLLADLRSAGRGASQGAIGELFDKRLPAMLSAFDGHGGETVAQTSRDRILMTVVSTTRARIELHGEPSASMNGHAHGILWPWQPATQPRPAARRWSWGLGLAGAAALLMVGWMLYTALNKPVIVKQDEKSGTSVPIPKAPEKRPDGPMVKGGTPPEKKLVPKPGPRKQDQRVAVTQPEVGKLDSVMGEPLVYAPGSKKGITARPGMKVAMGSTIETGDADKLELKFTDGTVLRLDFNTKIEIPRAGGAKVTSSLVRPDSITLAEGRLYAMVTHHEDGAHFKVETPAATAEVLGTEFGLTVERLAKKQDGPDYKTTLQVKQGKVRFFNDLGERTATDLTEIWATEDSMPTAPKRVSSVGTIRLSGSHVIRVMTSRMTYGESFESMAGSIGTVGWQIYALANSKVGISKREPKGPVGSVGLRPTDQVFSVNGLPVRGDLATWLTVAERAGGTVTLGVLRENRVLVRTVQVRAGHPDADSNARGYSTALRAATLRALKDRNEAGRQGLGLLVDEFASAAAANNLGVSHESSDDMARAIRYYRLAIDRNPASPLFHANLGRALYKIGNLRRATEEFGEASALAPAWLEAKKQWIKCLYLTNRASEALDEVQKLLDASPNSAELLALKGEVLTVLGDPQQGIDVLTRSVSIDPFDAHAWFELGEAHHDLKNLAEAETAFRRATEIDPADAGPENNLGVVLMQAGKLKEAEAHLRRAVAIYPRWTVAVNSLGSLLFDLQRYREAEECFRTALEIEPSNMLVLGNLGNVLRQTGQVKEAEKLLRGAIERSPGHPAPYDMLGLLLWQTGRPAEAERYAREACRLDSGNALVHVRLGVILGALGKVQEQEQALQAAVAAEPNNFYAHDNLGALFSGMGRWAEAEKHSRKAIELNPRFPGAYNNLAWSLWMLGRSEEAMEAFRKAIAHPRREALAFVGFGDILLRSGHGAESVEVLRKGTRAFPKDALVHAILALTIALTSGDLDEALRLAQAATELDPLLMEARAILGTVHLHRNEVAKAEEHLSAALRGTAFGRSGFSAIRWADLGLVYERGGRNDLAKGAYGEALRLDRNEQRAVEGLKRLGG
ncbi:MAG: tetratricopeptide repeat protein [Armatimonadetes bacterium]|nr:tetratricopeptide repeat protein [Armatimonadota bacterium]